MRERTGTPPADLRMNGSRTRSLNMNKRIDFFSFAPVRSWTRAALSALLLAAGARSARAAFDLPTVGAQAAAMGGASLANRADSAALFLNPAGGAGLQRTEAYFLYNRLYAGLPGVDKLGQSFAAVGVPTKLGVLGVGYSDFQASGLLEERLIGVAFARRWFDAFEAGVTAKYLYHRYMTGSDPSASDRKSTRLNSSHIQKSRMPSSA